MKKYGLKAEVKEGSSNEILNEYIGHIENTSTYDGNVGLAGHNRGNKNSYFARLNELENGDIITYKTNFFTRKYKVDNIQTILETDWNLLKETDQNKLTLIKPGIKTIIWYVPKRSINCIWKQNPRHRT